MAKRRPVCVEFKIIDFENFEATVRQYAEKGMFPVDIRIVYIAGICPSKITAYFVNVEKVVRS